MNPLDFLFNQIKDQITDHSSDRTPGPSYDPNSLLGNIAGIFGQHAQQSGGQFDPGEYGNVQSSNQDPYGDPGAQGGGGQFGNVQSSNQDPYGDPGARGGGGGQFGNVKSSNEDPYGDPGAR
jgi:hypothetical protein